MSPNNRWLWSTVVHRLQSPKSVEVEVTCRPAALDPLTTARVPGSALLVVHRLVTDERRAPRAVCSCVFDINQLP